MARVEKADRGIGARLDEIEEKLFVLKINYDKYFSGLERKEPYRDREEVRRLVRDLLEEPMRQPSQRFRYQQLKARLQSMELFWNRNVSMIERGVHPKFKFRADLHDRARRESPAAGAPPVETISAEQQAVLQARQEQMAREEKAFRMVFDRYLEARQKCGQSTDLAYDAVRDALRKQVRSLKATYNTEQVRFRVVIEEGKAKVKAVPVVPQA